jgi:ureidoacrylate peracid hydrolase
MPAAAIVLAGRYYRNYPVGAPLGHTEELFELELDRTVFLVIDVYGQGYAEEAVPDDVPELYSKWARDHRDVVVNHIAPAKAAAKQLGLPVIYLTNYLSPALTEQSELRKTSLRVDGIDLLEAWREPNDILSMSDVIAPAAGEFVIKKQFYSGFFETPLGSLLSSLDARNLVTVGFESQVCLATTVTDAMYRNYRVFVLRDAIATAEWEETAQERWANFLAVRFIETHVGVTCTTTQWTEACQNAAAATAGGREPRHREEAGL